MKDKKGFTVEDKLDTLIELTKEHNEADKNHHEKCDQFFECKLEDEPKERIWNRWEFYAAFIGLLLSALFVFSNFYSMNAVYCPHALANFLNWMAGYPPNYHP